MFHKDELRSLVTLSADEQSDSIVKTRARNSQIAQIWNTVLYFHGGAQWAEPGDNISINRRGLVSNNQGVLSAHCRSKKQLEYVPQGLEPHGWH